MGIRTKGTVYLILCSLIWGASFPLIEIADRTIPPITFTMSRMAIGAMLLYAYLRLRGDCMPRLGRAWIPFVIMGVFGTLLPVLFLAFGEEDVTSGFTAVVLSTVPVITVVIAHFFAEEGLTTAKLIGAAVGFAGACIVLSPDLARGVEVTIIGTLLILVVALCRASSNVYAHTHLKNVTPIHTATGMMISATAITLPLAVIIDNPLAVRPSTEGVISIIVSGIFCSAVAYLLLYWLIANRGPTFASLVECIMPAVAVFYSATFMGETIEVTTLAGMIVLVVCIVIMNGYVGKGAEVRWGRHVSAKPTP